MADRRFGRGGRPEAAATGQVVELIKQGHAQVFGKVRALQDGGLPALNRGGPYLMIPQGFGRDGAGVIAPNPKEIRVTPQSPISAGKTGDRQVPADRQRNLQTLPRLQAKADRQGGTQRFVLPCCGLIVVIGDCALPGEGFPEFAAIAGGIPAAAAHHFDRTIGRGQAIGHGQTPLALALRQGFTALAFEHQPQPAGAISPAVALTTAGADGRDVIVFRTAVVTEMDGSGGVGVREPATGIAPAQQQGQV